MEIEDRREYKDVSFGRLSPGDAFEFCGTVYLKMDMASRPNAVILETGVTDYFNDSNAVTPLNVKLVIGEE